MDFKDVTEEDIKRLYEMNYSQKEILRMVQCSGVPTPTYWAAVVEIVISILGLIFNFVAIFVIVVLKDFKKSISHWYVLQLAIADSLFLAMLPLRAIQDFTGSWELPKALCSLYQGIFMMNYYSGIFFLTLMSFDRYVAIVHPVSATWRKLRTHGNAVLITLGVWVLSISVSLPLWVWADVKCVCEYHFPQQIEEMAVKHGLNYTEAAEVASWSEEKMYEEMDFISEQYGEEQLADYIMNKTSGAFHKSCQHDDIRSFKTWAFLNFVVAFVCPVIVMSVCYSLILWRVLHPQIRSADRNAGRKRSIDVPPRPGKNSIFRSLRLSSTSSTGSGDKPRSGKMSQTQRVTCIVVSLVISFIVCWLPFHAVLLWKFAGLPYNDPTSCTNLSHVASLMAFSNSMLNPIFYTFLGSRFCQRLNTATWSVRKNTPSSRLAGFAYVKNSRTRAPSSSRFTGAATGRATESTIAHAMTVHSTLTSVKVSQPAENINHDKHHQRLISGSDNETAEHQMSPERSIEMKPIYRSM